ncbi:hypothetical protein [Geomicrobium sediminis]|uniref:Chemotaxis protein histidine kinase CheA n=1 Tax=Geomicrobium sediminis TaxID=1347788 RepID=A0ABS2PDY6_9BACL|nr:hypothetical protein [Geomicrobium sediminis]MBM7633637.1 chemotaxis protein histidine kinase CheA [Geomicrobium sediminis]
MDILFIGLSVLLFAPLAFGLLVTFIILFVRKNRLRKHFGIAAGAVAGLALIMMVVGLFNIDWSSELADAEERNAEREEAEEQRLVDEAEAAAEEAEAKAEAKRIAQEDAERAEQEAEAKREAERVAEEEAEVERLAEETAAAEAKEKEEVKREAERIKAEEEKAARKAKEEEKASKLTGEELLNSLVIEIVGENKVREVSIMKEEAGDYLWIDLDSGVSFTANTLVYGMNKDYLDIGEILINEMDDFDRVNIHFHGEFIDQYGNDVERQASHVTWESEELAKMNFDNLYPDDVPRLATGYTLHPALQ